MIREDVDCKEAMHAAELNKLNATREVIYFMVASKGLKITTFLKTVAYGLGNNAHARLSGDIRISTIVKIVKSLGFNMREFGELHDYYVNNGDFIGVEYDSVLNVFVY